MYVYVVLYGCFDSQSIQGIYSTREKAEQVIKTMNKLDYPTLEKWKVDDETYYLVPKRL